MQTAPQTLAYYKGRFQETLTQLYPPPEAQAIFRRTAEHILKIEAYQIPLRLREPLLPAEEQAFETALARLATGEPLQYVLGETVFCGLSFKVNSAVLIPRPETEELVNWIAENAPQPGLKIMDIGTGSGCIIIALAARLNNAQAIGMDVSSAALDLAIENARTNEQNIRFLLKNILEAQPDDWADIDIVVSNPPYVPFAEKNTLRGNVVDFEPHLALFAPTEDPLIFYRTIGRLSISWLRPGGWLYFETHEDYAEATAQVLATQGWQNIELKTDVYGKNRMLRAQRPAAPLAQGGF